MFVILVVLGVMFNLDGGMKETHLFKCLKYCYIEIYGNMFNAAVAN